MAKRKVIGRRKKIGDTYEYPGGKYKRKKVGGTKGVTAYRTIKVKGKEEEKILIGIKKKKGPRGGKTKAVALLKPKTKKKRR